MESGQDADAPASSAQELKDGLAAAGDETPGPEDDGPGAGAEGPPPVGAEESGIPGGGEGDPPVGADEGGIPGAGAEGDPPVGADQGDTAGGGAEDQTPAGGDAGEAPAGDDGAPAAGDDEEAVVAAAKDKRIGSPEPAAGSGDSAEPDRAARAPVWVAAMAALLAMLIAGVVVSVVFLARVSGSDAANSRRQTAVAAARHAVTDLTTADYQHPQQYVGKLKADATGSFLSQFTNSSTGFQQLLEQGKVQTTGNVVDVGVQRIGTDTAQLSALAYVTVKNSQTPGGAQRVYRLSVSMISAGSRWLVSKVEFVQ